MFPPIKSAKTSFLIRNRINIFYLIKSLRWKGISVMMKRVQSIKPFLKWGPKNYSRSHRIIRQTRNLSWYTESRKLTGNRDCSALQLFHNLYKIMPETTAASEIHFSIKMPWIFYFGFLLVGTKQFYTKQKFIRIRNPL